MKSNESKASRSSNARWITQLTLRNFKNVSEQIYKFTQFDLLVGLNNEPWLMYQTKRSPG